MTDAIVHVVRCFVDDDIIHVDGTVDPVRDIEVINLELILADIAQIEKRLEKARRDKRAVPEELSALEKVNTALLAGKLQILSFSSSLLLFQLSHIYLQVNQPELQD